MGKRCWLTFLLNSTDHHKYLAARLLCPVRPHGNRETVDGRGEPTTMYAGRAAQMNTEWA